MKTIYIALLLGFTLSLSAQEGRGRGNRMDREKLEAARIAFLTNRLDLTPDSAKDFWPLFNEYEKKKNELNKSYNDQKRSLVPEEGMEKITEANAAKMLDIYVEQKQAEINLEKAYLGRFQKILPSTKVWMVLRFDSEFRRSIMQRINRDRDRGNSNRSKSDNN